MLSRRANSAAGFTMIEAMVTLSVFALLVALAVPTMSTWIRNNKVRTVSDSLQTGLRFAQAEALRRSRQVVFALTNSTTPNFTPVAADPNGTSYAIWTIPSMTDGSEVPEFVQSGELSNASAGVAVAGVAAVCFSSMGRVIGNTSASVIAITGGPTCSQPAGPPYPPVQQFAISLGGSDRPLQVNLGLGGQIHMCDPGVTLSDSHPEGCR
jgi:type IV fimbrial biogenesis protein FimT